MLERQDNMVLGFVGIEKAFDTVPREMATVVLEAEAMMVRAIYERRKEEY